MIHRSKDDTDEQNFKNDEKEVLEEKGIQNFKDTSQNVSQNDSKEKSSAEVVDKENTRKISEEANNNSRNRGKSELQETIEENNP